MERRMTFRTRLGPALESELGNTWPIVKIFRDWEFTVPLDWSSVHRVVEVGGHVGAFALWAAAHAPRARVVTFEPEPRNFRDLRRNIQRNGLADRVVSVNAAVAAEDGRRTLDVPIQRNRATFTSASAGGTIEVDCVGLERYLDEEHPDPIDVLKLDCEGAEWEILPSLSGETYDRVHHIIVGCHAHRESEVEEMKGLLASRGFTSRLVTTGADPDYALLVTLWGERR
jgi:FkbM family methyltransferase